MDGTAQTEPVMTPDERRQLEGVLDGWKQVAKRDAIAIAETRTALTRMYNAHVALMEVLEHEQGLSEAVEEAMRRADIMLGDVPLRLMDGK